MARLLLLVHSPLVGPSSWSKVGLEARRRSVAAVAPDSTGFVDGERPRWSRFVDMAVGPVDDQRVVAVGHSGAGALLPAIAARLGEQLDAVVFVDAVLPGDGADHELSADMAALLDAQTTDRHLAPWLDWWPAPVVEALLPAPDDRQLLRSDMPQVPRDTYDDPVHLPAGWTRQPGAYLQLSGAYAEDARRAERLGWPCQAIDGTHLSIATEPALVLDAILSLADAAGRA